MRMICRLSRRWNHQLYRFQRPRSHLQSTLYFRQPALHPVRHYAQGRTGSGKDRDGKEDGDDDLEIEEFEQIGTDKSTRVRVNPKEELELMQNYLKSELDKVDAKLNELRKGPFDPDGEFMQSLSPEEREIAREVLEEQGGMPIPDLMEVDLKEIDRLVEEQHQRKTDDEHDPAPQISLQHPLKHQVYIRILNTALKQFVAVPQNDARKKALWRAYERCSRHVPNLQSLIPPKAWDLLWQSQTELPDNAANVLSLARNMLVQSMPLSSIQLLVYMESLRSVGELSAAIECWEENRSSLGPDEDLAERFWSLGVQLYCENKDPQTGHDIAVQCLDFGSFAHPKILLPVIASWARVKESPHSLENAWACYLRFKAELGSEIKEQDYESISTMFLNQGHPDMALGIFKDMMLDKYPEGGKELDSLSAFQRLTGRVRNLQTSAIDADEVNRVSLTALTSLPRNLQNGFFYSAWMKKLLSVGEVDAAAKVVELMYERGMRPHAKHLNGLVAAWLRDDCRGFREKAINMAWGMVQARVDLVCSRRQDTPPPRVVKTLEGKVIPTFVVRPMPAATIETFSILLLYYTRRCQDQNAHDLMDVMTNQAMIAPNVYMLNHWIYASLRAHDLESVWSQYIGKKDQIKPDLETWGCLWSSAKLQWDPSRSSHWDGFPTARALFREMHDWATQQTERELTQTRSDFSRALYDQLILVFCFSFDLPGILCAIHGIKQLYNAYPDSTTSRIILVQLARLTYRPPQRPTRPFRSRKVPQSAFSVALDRATRIHHAAADRRIYDLVVAGKDPNNLDDDAKNKLQLDALSDLLVSVIKSISLAQSTTRSTCDFPRPPGPDPADIRSYVAQVAEEMNVSIDEIGFNRDDENEDDDENQ